MLKNALFRGGLATETLETLLAGELDYSNGDTTAYNPTSWEETYVQPKKVPVVITAPRDSGYSPDDSNTTVGGGSYGRPQRTSFNRVHSFGQPDSSIDDISGDKDDEHQSSSNPAVPKNDQRTILIGNLAERTTHKDLVNIIRGGRLLDIYIRNDRSATVSFVEGAQEFLTYAKRNDFYLHTKRLEVRWNDRQFHVPHHVSNKIAIGATRNLVVRGATGKLTEKQIRDDLDHIHNLVVIDVLFKEGDAYISTNSIHNALFARTCMMSRTTYKGLRIDWYPDECAAPLPQPANFKSYTPVSRSLPAKPVATLNRYNLLNTDGTEASSDDEESLSLNDGVPVTNWTEATAA
jgi:hypothetical protein